MTGEAALVRKCKGSSVFAGTAVEAGSILLRATATSGQSRIDGIVDMVENSQELKASVQSRAEDLADRMVPFSLAMFLFVLAVTRDPQRAMSVLMVDYSCAIKLASPIAVMSAMREATQHKALVKGGKYLEALAEADTIVFDKTGTLTCANPQVTKVIALDDMSEDEVLKLAACLEEHYPHSVARAIVARAAEVGLSHEDENHGEVEYVVAHGVASTVDGAKCRIGSAHFIFEDEGVPVPDGLQELVESQAAGSSPVYMAKDGELCGVICISDPLREEAAGSIASLRAAGFENIVMLTGDLQQAAQVVADKLELDDFRAQVLPEDKSSYIKALKEQGHVVCMVGDGINDSPALAEANVSIAMSDASDIARTVADISVLNTSLATLVDIRALATGLMKRIEGSYRFIVTSNSSLIALGAFGILQPATSATLHNLSIVAVAAANTRPILERPRHTLLDQARETLGRAVDGTAAVSEVAERPLRAIKDQVSRSAGEDKDEMA